MAFEDLAHGGSPVSGHVGEPVCPYVAIVVRVPLHLKEADLDPATEKTAKPAGQCLGSWLPEAVATLLICLQETINQTENISRIRQEEDFGEVSWLFSSPFLFLERPFECKVHRQKLGQPRIRLIDDPEAQIRQVPVFRVGWALLLNLKMSRSKRKENKDEGSGAVSDGGYI